MITLLWPKIEAFEIDDADSRIPFSTRLARENGWSASYARRCITEYKKFIYLCAIGKSAMTPSDQVDQVWHLHLIYTKSYWSKFCGDVLGFDLHHEPTKGGDDQVELFFRQYNETLDFYREVFNEAPPADIWPDAKARFQDSDRYVRINKAMTWSFPKPSAWFSFLLSIPLLLVACTREDGSSDVWLYIKIAIIAYVFYRVFKWLSSHRNGKDGSGCGGGCGGCGGG